MTFQGFGTDAVRFWQELEADNSTAHWRAHRDIFDAAIAEPLAALALELTSEFGQVHRFRPQRDTRFSPDKRPYQLHCSLVATADQAVGAMLYFQFGIDGVLLAGGSWQPDTTILASFREAVDDDQIAASFDLVLADLAEDGFTLDGRSLKTAPRGWSRDHPRIDLLRLRNLALHRRFDLERWVNSSECAGVVTGHWRALNQWNSWLSRHVAPRLAAG